jgi:molybdenum cofactor cytidylyltransferase
LPNDTDPAAHPHNHSSIAGVILAAGESRRMGRDKALLPVGEHTFVEHLIEVLQPELSPIAVVLGHHAEEIERQITADNVLILKNPNYKLGQLSSLQVAMKYLINTNVAAAIVALVDHPAITASVVRALVGRFRETGAPIAVPVCHGRRGHPVLFARSTFQELLDAPLDEGARYVVHQHASEMELVETEEEGILWDLDFPADYERFVASLQRG